MEGHRRPLRAAVAVLALVLAAPASAGAAELTVLCARGVRQVVAAIADDFHRAARHTVWLSYPGTEGIVPRAEATAVDVVIAPVADMDALEARGVVQRGTRVVLGQVPLGIAVRAGTPLPDISTPSRLRRAVLLATSLAHLDPERDPVGRHVVDALAAIGIAPLVRPKTTFVAESARAVEAVGRGDVALAIVGVSDIRGVDDVAFAGTLPASLQHSVVYAAGVHARSATPDGAAALVQHLAGDAARARLAAGGLEPVP